MTARRYRTTTWRRIDWRPYLYVDRDRTLGTDILAGWFGHGIALHWGPR